MMSAGPAVARRKGAAARPATSRCFIIRKPGPKGADTVGAMRVQEPTEDLADPQPSSPQSPDRPLATLTRNLALVALVGGLVAGFFLAIYLFASEPIGWDTARYLDQTNLATKWGLSGAAHLVLPRPSQLLGSRVGFPTTVMGLGAL